MTKVVAYVPAGSPVDDAVPDGVPEGWDLARVDTLTASRDDLNREVADADFLMVFGAKIRPETLQAGKNLRLVNILHAGFDGFPVAEAGELGIPVATASGTNSQGVAEMALTLMLSLYRHLTWLDSAIRDGQWIVDRAAGHDSYEIEGKTIGIVGLGNIGSITARLVQGFNPTILYADIEAKPEIEEKTGASRVDLDELLSESDIVTLHTPLDDSTRGLIGRRELALMKPSAILINTCRGPVVVEAALLEALRERRIWGAGLDVFEQEPTPGDNPLLQLENIVVAPHLAGQTAESYPRRAGLAFENMQRILNGQAPHNLVTPT
jgi:phosphoglycerate dehydrogenase-like enzyme